MIPVFVLAFAGLSAANLYTLYAQAIQGPLAHLSAIDYLPTSDVYAILQDRRGTLWFGTMSGLTRFDGFAETLTTQDGLPDNEIHALAEDAEGGLWIGTGHTGAARFSDGHWTGYTQAGGLAGNLVRAILRGPNGDLWFATDGGISRYAQGIWTSFSTQDGLPSNQVYTLAFDRLGRLWAGTDEGLAVSKGSGWQSWHERGAPIGRIFGVMFDHKGGLWAASSDHGVFHRDGEHWENIATVPQANVPDVVWAISEARDGALWFGTNGRGAQRYVPALGPQQARLELREAQGLLAGQVRVIYPDRDGVIWLGTISGVSKYTGNIWQPVEPAGRDQTPIGDTQITALLTDADKLWVTTAQHGVWELETNTWRVFTSANSGLPSNHVFSVLRDQAGALWFGTDKGATRLLHNQWQALSIADGLADNWVSALALTPDQSLWFGSGGLWAGNHQGAGISQHMPDGTWRIHTAANGLPGTSIYSLQVDREGRLWAGSEAGVGVWNGNTWKSFTASTSSLAPGQVRNIFQDKGGGLWFSIWGTAGSSQLRSEKQADFSRIVPPNSAPSTAINLIWQDDSGSTWYGTYGGLVRADGQTSQLYSSMDGLGSSPVTAMTGDGNGGAWVGTGTGLIHYQPDHTPPQVRVKRVNGQAVPSVAQPITLTASAAVFDLEGGDLLDPANTLVYTYRLQPKEQTWHVTTDPFLDYKALAPGTYTLAVRVRDRNFNYSPLPTMLTVVVPIPEPQIDVFGARVSRNGFIAGMSVSMLSMFALTYTALSDMQRKRRPQRAIERHFNPYVAGEPIRREDMFFGRRAILERMLTTLHENSIMIHGERRIGKTTLLHQLAARLATANDPEYEFVPVLIDLEGTVQEQFFHRIMEGIVEVVEDRLPDGKALLFRPNQQTYDDRSFRRDLRDIMVTLQAQQQRMVRLILLMDEVDVLNTYDALIQQQLRRIFMDTFAQNIGAVVAGVHISKAWDRQESPWYNLFNEIEITRFSQADTLRLIREPVRGIYAFSDEAVQFILQRSECRPHRVQQLCLEAVNCMLDERRARVTLQDARAADARLLKADENYHSELAQSDTRSETERVRSP